MTRHTRSVVGRGGVALRLRPWGSDDVEAVVAVHEASARQAYRHIFPSERPFPREETRRRWQTFAGRLVVAEDGGRVVGFVAFDHRELHALYVLPAQPRPCSPWERAPQPRPL